MSTLPQFPSEERAITEVDMFTIPHQMWFENIVNQSVTTPVGEPLTASLLVATDANQNVVSLAKSSAYTRTATVVEDRTLLASASATTLNNNNVLAALIADLQTAGVLA